MEEVEYKGRKYAAKIYRSDKQTAMFQEFEIGAKIRHPNIVQYLCVCQLDYNRRSGILMEKMEMNLSTYIGDHEKVNIPLLQKFQVLFHIALGLDYLQTHRPVIIHGDLTARNILLDSKGVAKIGDFEHSLMVDLNATPRVMVVNPRRRDYMPPEALQDDICNEKLDIFSFGHLTIYIIIQHRPHPLLKRTYRVHGNLIVRKEVERRQTYIEEMTTKLGMAEHPLLAIITGSLHDEPNHRPSSSNILQVLAICLITCSKLTPADKVLHESAGKSERERSLGNLSRVSEGMYAQIFTANECLHIHGDDNLCTFACPFPSCLDGEAYMHESSPSPFHFLCLLFFLHLQSSFSSQASLAMKPI